MPLFRSAITVISKAHKCHALTHEISGCSHINLPVCPMKGSRSWLHMPTRTTDLTYLKLLPVSPKTVLGKKKEKKNGNANVVKK